MGNPMVAMVLECKSRVMAYCPKELLPVLLLCIVWGKEGPGKLIRCHCDNMPVVEVLNCSFHNSGFHNSGYSRDREMMPLLRGLIFCIAEHFHLQVEAVHLPGKENGLPDALSHNNIPHFQQARPGAAKSPTHLPRQALALLVEEQPDWTSPHWTSFVSSIGKDLHKPHSRHMRREEMLPQLLRETRYASTTSHRGPAVLFCRFS